MLLIALVLTVACTPKPENTDVDATVISDCNTCGDGVLDAGEEVDP